MNNMTRWMTVGEVEWGDMGAREGKTGDGASFPGIVIQLRRHSLPGAANLTTMLSAAETPCNGLSVLRQSR